MNYTIITTIPDRLYCVTAAAGTMVTDTYSQQLLATVGMAGQSKFIAIGTSVQVSSLNADVRDITFDSSSSSELNEQGQTIVPVTTETIGSLAPNTIHNLGLVDLLVLDLSTLGLANVTDSINTCELWFKTGSHAPAVVWPISAVWLGSEGAPTLLPNKSYAFALRYDGERFIMNLCYEIS